MSKINLQTSDDIISFLQILAEESVVAAKNSLSSDSLQSSIYSKMKSDEKLYGSLDEQPDEDQEEEEQELDQDMPEPTPEEAPQGDDLEVSLDSISRAVKDLRSGRSVDDSRMKEELRAYFDRLEPTEREALYAFLKSFGGILTGVYPGSEAPDPSDPPYNISMNQGGTEKPEEAEQSQPSQQAEPRAEEDFEEEVEEAEPADSPPIKAGSGQDLSEIRKRVRSLMHLS